MSDTLTIQTLLTVCKLRWVPKQPTDQMTINNLEALRLMATSILLQQQDKWQEAEVAAEKAEKVLQKELEQYMSGVQHTIPFVTDTFGMNDFGDPL